MHFRKYESFVFFIMFILSIVSGCSNVSIRSQSETDSAPRAIPEGLEDLPDPKIIIEPLSRIGNHSPYTVNGQTYQVMSRPAAYRREGKASWYGTKFHDRLTSNGEKYDMFKLTAAHKHLPLPSYVEVTNLDNLKRAIVRVNDRGPFHDDRLIDVSYAAAVKLGFAQEGIARVLIELKTAGEPEVNESLPSARIEKRFFLQLAGFENLKEADVIAGRLESIEQIIYSPVILSVGSQDGYQVRVGPYKTRKETERLQALAVIYDISPLTIIEQ